MFYAIVWIIVSSLLAVWSLAAWGLHAVGVWAVSNAGTLSGAAASAGGLHLPQWVAAWVPPELARSSGAMLTDLAFLVDNLLQSVPALAGGVSVAVWVLWGIGAAILIALGVASHLITSAWRRKLGDRTSTVGAVTAG